MKTPSSRPTPLSTRVMPFSALVTAGALMLTGCGGDPLAEDGAENGSGGDSAPGAITVGSADFAESQVLANIYSLALEDAGLEVSESFNIGSREVYIEAVQDGSIDLVPEYAGALLTYLDEDTDATQLEDVLGELDEALPEGMTQLEEAEAENRNTLVVTPETANEYGLETFSDLEPHAEEMVLGGPPEWIDRFNGVVGLEEVYGLEFQDFSVLDAGGPLSLSAVVNGQVDVVNLNSTDPQVEENDLVTLEDDQNLFASMNVLPIMAADKLNDDVEVTLNEISAVLTTEDLTGMNQRASQGENMSAIAEDWLNENGLL